jgi:hypothetical protein
MRPVNNGKRFERSDLVKAQYKRFEERKFPLHYALNLSNLILRKVEQFELGPLGPFEWLDAINLIRI